jgi:hypothetical protein
VALEQAELLAQVLLLLAMLGCRQALLALGQVLFLALMGCQQGLLALGQVQQVELSLPV